MGSVRVEGGVRGQGRRFGLGSRSGSNSEVRGWGKSREMGPSLNSEFGVRGLS